MQTDLGMRPMDLRRQNYQTIIQLFRNHTNLAIRDIMNAVSLSKTSISNILNNLMAMNIIYANGKGESTNQGGKKPELYALNLNYRYVIVIYIHHEECLCQLMNMEYSILAEFVQICPHPTGYSYKEIISLIANGVNSVLEKVHISQEQLCGLVLHCGGIVNVQKGVLSRPILSPQWGNDLPILEDVQQKLCLDVPFYLDNTSRYHGYFELLNRPDRLKKNIITLFCSTSVGGSQIRMGHLIHGLTGLVGEYGHITTDYSFTERCNCGNYGCFETSVSEGYLLHRIHSDLCMYNNSSILDSKDSSFTMADVFQAANNGDALIRKHLDFVIQQFAVLIYNMQITYDPDEIIIQGIYAASDGYFQDTLHNIINQHSLHRLHNHINLTYSKSYSSKDDMQYAMIGASLFCFDQYFKQFHPPLSKT